MQNDFQAFVHSRGSVLVGVKFISFLWVIKSWVEETNYTESTSFCDQSRSECIRTLIFSVNLWMH